MPQDLITIKKIAKDLNLTIVGAKVNKVLQPNAFEIDLVLFKKTAFRLILNTHAKFARVSISNAEKKNPEVAPNFCMLLRKHLTGAEVTNVEVANDDRVVSISFSNLNDFKESVSIKLYAEIMGKYSNLFLVKDGKILGVLRQLPQGLDSKRITLVGAPYKFPDKSEKISIFSAGAKEKFLTCFNNFNAKFLTANFYDFSPVTATEIERLVSARCGENFDGETAYQTVVDFLNSTPSPVVISDGIKSDFFFTDYLFVLGERTTYKDVITAMESVYSALEKDAETSNKLRDLYSYISSYEKKVLKKVSILSDRISSSSDVEKYKLYGELITSYLYLLKKGQTKATLINYTEEGEKEINVPLDENLTPQQNAQKYFKLYHKKKNTLTQSELQLQDAKRELDYLASIKFSISRATENSDFEEIYEELVFLGLAKEQKKNKNKKSQPLGFIKYQIDGFSALVGKNNLQNDKLLSASDRLDTWFHVKAYHSSHLILKTNGKPAPLSTIQTCAEICAYHSQANGISKVEVDYTLRKFVKKQGGKNLGGVYYTDQKTILVTPNNHEELKKD